MNPYIRVAAASLALSATAAFAGHCGKSPQADAMRARVKTMHEQMDRAEYARDRSEQRALMDLHMKHMQEGLRELRKRELSAACRIELMSAMMETMVRAQMVAHADDR